MTIYFQIAVSIIIHILHPFNPIQYGKKNNRSKRRKKSHWNQLFIARQFWNAILSYPTKVAIYNEKKNHVFNTCFMRSELFSKLLSNGYLLKITNNECVCFIWKTLHFFCKTFNERQMVLQKWLVHWQTFCLNECIE